MTKPVLCLLGPTASGKTKLAMRLADELPVDLISVDSALVYRHMNIGTAKPSAEELACYPHQMVDLIDPDESYSVARFMADVEGCIQTSLLNHRIPLLVGGTMMYFQAIQQGLSQLPAADESLRMQLLTEGQDKGWPYLHARLATIDPKTAARIHPHDKQRIQRALEVYQLTGQPLSHLLASSQALPYHFENLLLLPRQRLWLHQNIELRFAKMLNDGLVGETEHILSQWPHCIESPAMRMVGYRQAYLHLSGALDEAGLMHKGIVASRQLAKRQITWLRRWQQGRIIVAEDEQNWQTSVLIIKEILDNRQ